MAHVVRLSYRARVVPAAYTLLNLTDLRLGLEDLLTVRREPLMHTHAGKASENTLELQRRAILALPAPLTGGRPYAEELALRHAECAGFGLAVWHVTEAYLKTPGIDPAIVEACRRVRHALIPNIERLRDAYPEQAAAAEVRKENISSVVDELSMIPIAGGGTLWDWAGRFIRAGEQIAKTLELRAEINAMTRKNAMTILADTLQILNDLRMAVAEEIANTIGMPRQLEHEIFGYFDVLEATRIDARRAVEQGQNVPGPMSTRGLTLPPASTRVIPIPPPSATGFASGPPSTRIIAPPRESSSGHSTIPPAPATRRSWAPPPPPVPEPKDD